MTDEEKQAEKPEIEVTPEMIEAAEDYLAMNWPEWPSNTTVAKQMIRGLIMSALVAKPRSE